ncbi:hypothetical protein [Nocardiopsis dassonvillei]|uniref:hypothetical protein n=1 Tax=Nocardiopsis dassonvillei TaxID=2014 RepID=UPI003F57D4D8
MIRPDSEDHQLVARWSALVRILLVESSVKLVALAAMQYADFHTGVNCRPGNLRLGRDTGYDERTVRRAWEVMRSLDMAKLVRHGVPYQGRADEYVLEIPDRWENFAILGPEGRPFHCLACGADVHPKGHNVIDKKTGRVSWRLPQFIFCKTPKDSYGCMHVWNKNRGRAGKPKWQELNNDQAWELFREARADDW